MQRRTRSIRVIFKWFCKCFFQVNLMSLLTSFNGFHFDVFILFLHLELNLFFVGLASHNRMKMSQKNHLEPIFVLCLLLFFFPRFLSILWVKQFAINIHIMVEMDYRSSDFLGFNGHFLLSALTYKRVNHYLPRTSSNNLLMDFTRHLRNDNNSL